MEDTIHKYQVDEVYPKNSVYPLIVHFQNGYLTDTFKSKECMLLENKETGKKSIAVELCDLMYTGDEEEEPLGKTLLLARNKKTGKVRLIEVGNVEVKPNIKSHSNISQVTEATSLELSRKFGSKKNKQLMEHREKLKVNQSTVVEQMNDVTQNLTEDQIDLSSYNKSSADEFYIPPINRLAQSVEDIYDIDSILTEKQYERIYSELEKSSYKVDLYEMLKPIAERNLPPKHIVLLVYTNVLLQLYGTMMKEIYKKNFVPCRHSLTLSEVIMNNFFTVITATGKRGRSPQYKDKSLCHALVFMYLINNYMFNVDKMAETLKIKPRTVLMKVALTGGTYNSTTKCVHLKLPLCKQPRQRLH